MRMSNYTELDHFGFLTITGKDALTFLQGYTTCDVNTLDDAHVGLGAMCNLQGRMVNSFLIATTTGGLLLRLDRALVESTSEFLKKYILFSKSEAHDESDTWQAFGIIGDDWDDGLPARVHDMSRRDDHFIIRVSDNGPRFEVWAEHTPRALASLDRDAGAEWRRREVEDGIAWVAPATADEFIPQMFNYHELGGVSFEKGCYLGQEIVARMQHRGELKRRLFRGETTSSVQPGDAIVNSDGRKVGTVVSTAPASGASHVLLAVVQTRALENRLGLDTGESLELAPVS